MQTTDSRPGQHPAPDASQPSAGPDKLPGIRHLVAVGSGKFTRCHRSSTRNQGVEKPEFGCCY